MKTKQLPKIPLAYYLLGISVLLAAFTGYKFPFRHFVEGEFGYFNIVVVILSGVIFLRTYQAVGSLETIMKQLAIKLGRYPVLFLFISMVFLYFPGMFTGLGVPGVVISGALVYPLLLKMNMPKIKAIAFVSICAMLGSVTGPVNIPVMIVACGINMPYEGFGLVLPAITIPLGIITTLFFGLKPALKTGKETIAEGIEITEDDPTGFKIYLPIIVVILLLVLPRFFPLSITDLGTPLSFIIGTIVALFSGRKIKVVKVFLDAVDSPIFEVAALLLSVGVLVQIATLIGLKGSIVTLTMSLSNKILFLAILVILPVVGGAVSMLGAAALFGLPFVLALLGLDTIVVTAGCSILCALSQVFPPTAIVGKVAGEIFGFDKYSVIFKECIIPVVVIALVSLLFIIFANPIAALLV